MADRRNNFSQGSIPWNILSLAVPMTAAQLVNVLYSVVDRIYLGRLPGSGYLALTGIGVTTPIISVLMGLANLCGTGGAPLCSISRGRGPSFISLEPVLPPSPTPTTTLPSTCMARYLSLSAWG